MSHETSITRYLGNEYRSIAGESTNRRPIEGKNIYISCISIEIDVETIVWKLSILFFLLRNISIGIAARFLRVTLRVNNQIVFSSLFFRGTLDTRRERERRGQEGGRAVGSYEELLEEVLGKQVLQIIVDAVVLVRRAGLAHAQYGQAKVLDLDARFGRSLRRVVAALRVSLDPSPSMVMVIASRPSIRVPGSPTIPADFIPPVIPIRGGGDPSSVVASPLSPQIYISRCITIQLAIYFLPSPRNNNSKGSRKERRRGRRISLTSRPWRRAVARGSERTRDFRLLSIHRNVGRPTTTNTWPVNPWNVRAWKFFSFLSLSFFPLLYIVLCLLYDRNNVRETVPRVVLFTLPYRYYIIYVSIAKRILRK